MGHHTTRNSAFLTTLTATLVAAAIALMMTPDVSFAVEATEIGPGQGRQGTPPGLTGKGEGPWAKAGSSLRRVFAAHSAHQKIGGGAPFEPGNPSIRFANGLILIDAVAADGDGAALLSELQAVGLKDGTAFGSVVSGLIPLGRLDKAVELGGLRAISVSLKPETNSAIDPVFGLVHDRSAAIAMGLIAAEADLQAFTGAGIKVGVLSDTFDNNSNPDYDGDGLGGPPATNADDDLLNGDLPGGGAYVALHVPGNVDDNDASAFGAIGTSGINTTAGNAIDSANRNASILYDPASFTEDPATAFISYPDSEHYSIETKPFTLEFWVKFATTYSNGIGPVLASHFQSANNQWSWFISLRGPSEGAFTKLQLLASVDGTSTNFDVANFPWEPEINIWYHVALARDKNSNLRAFVDGQKIGVTEQFPTNFFNTSAPLRISSFDNGPNASRPLDGRMEDFRFVVGEALYTSNFTPPGPLASELPSTGPVATTNVVAEGTNPGIDEGRAMMQLVHDVAPDASLSFHSAFNGLADFAQGILDLAADGADVIVDDIIYFAEPMFQDGIIAQAVDQVVSQGIPYFSSAGNSARKSYESPFVASGERLTVNGFFGPEERGMLHDFDTGPGVDFMQSVTIPVGATFTLVTQWDQPFASTCAGCPGAANDVDIYLVDDSLQIIASSTSDNLTSGEPVEVLQYANSGLFGTNLNIMMTHYDVVTAQHPQPGSPPTLMKSVWFGQSTITVNEYNTNSAASYGHANAAGAAAVGAAFYQDTPGYLTSPPLLESFSSAGGTPILFDVAGNPLGVPEVREKPEFVAPDGTNTTFFFRDTAADTDLDPRLIIPTYPTSQFPNFFGTSAAAPHAAAIAALMLEANPGLLPADIYSILEDTAIDMGVLNVLDPFDFDTGYGLIDATAALAQVTGGNLVPVAQNDNAVTFENTLVSIPVLANDALGDQPTTITFVTDPPNGTAVINGTAIDYTPDTDYDGSDSFDYTIAETNTPAETSTATVNVTVNILDVLPSAAPDAATTDEDTPAAGLNLMSNDDPGNAPATITSAGPVSLNGGTVSISPDGTTVTYNPPLNYFGLSDTFPYTITDSDGDLASAMVTMTVNPVNDAPVFDSDSYVKANGVAGEPYTGETLAGAASDLENNGLTYSITAGPTWLTITPDGILGGTPINPDNVGVNPFTVTVTDNGTPAESDTANLFITVDAPPVNNLPTAIDDIAAAVLEDSGLANHAVLGNDSFGGDGPGVGAIALGPVTGGNATVNTGGTATDPTDDSIDFTPAGNFNGNATVGYTIEDATGDQASAILTIPVTAVNDAPVAVADPGYSTNQDSALNVSAIGGVLSNDTDTENDPLTATLVTGVTSGSLTLNPDGSFNYIPNASFNGVDSFTYLANDGLVNSASAATVTITVNPAAPVVHIGAISASSAPAPRGRWDATVTVTIHLADHSPVSGTLIEGAWSNGANGGASCTTGAAGQCSVSKGNLKGNVASVDFTVTNVTPASGTYSSGANDASNSITVLQTGNPVNLLPNAVNDSATTTMNLAVGGNVLTNDDQGDAPATVTSTNTTGTLGSLGGGIVASDGAYTYTPPNNFTGADSFGYTITDNNGDTSSATVTITVNSVGNAAPVAVDDPNYSTTENVTLNVPAPGVLGNDTDGDGDPLTAVLQNTVLNGALTLNADGSFDYVPNPGFNGTDSFTYFARDGTVNSSTPATVTITIDPAPGAISLNATGRKVKGFQFVDLTWSGAPGSNVDIVRTGTSSATIPVLNFGSYTDAIDVKGKASYTYMVCETDNLNNCSNPVNVVF